MKTEVVKMNGYDARLLKTDKYNVFTIAFMFELEYTRYNIFLISLLCQYLFHINSKYKNREKIQEAFRENYSMSMPLYTINKGDKLFVKLGLTLPDPQKVNAEYLESALSLAHDIFFNIYKKNNKLDEYTLKLIKDKKINNKGSDLSDPYNIQFVLFEKNVYKDSYYIIDHIDSKKEYADILNSYSDKEILWMHSHIINNCFVGCHLLGNYRKKDIALIKKYFPFKYHMPLTDYKYNVNLDNVPKYIEYSNNKISTSYLKIVYKIDSYKISEIEKFKVIDMALNEVGMLLYKTLREEKQIVYYASSTFLEKSGIFEIRLEINKDNEKNAITGIDEVFAKLKDDKLVKEILKRAKKEIKLSNYVEDESYLRVEYRMISEYYKFTDIKKNITRRFMNVTLEDIINALPRIKKVTTYIYRGEKE